MLCEFNSTFKTAKKFAKQHHTPMCPGLDNYHSPIGQLLQSKWKKGKEYEDCTFFRLSSLRGKQHYRCKGLVLYFQSDIVQDKGQSEIQRFP